MIYQYDRDLSPPPSSYYTPSVIKYMSNVKFIYKKHKQKHGYFIKHPLQGQEGK